MLCETQQKDKQEKTNCFHDSIPLNAHLQIACSEIWTLPSRLCPYIVDIIDFPFMVSFCSTECLQILLRNVNTDVYLFKHCHKLCS